MQFPNDENGDVLRRMQNSGFDFNKEHVFDYYHTFESRTSAEQFAAMLHGHKIHAEVQPNKKNLWDVVVKIMHAPTHSEITEWESDLEVVANKFGGLKDGWGVMQE
ncbi:ribonuclease E inhibitor RraB [Pseudomonas sp. MAP12]|uniref:Ribonuclease E inhibitor RraB n=1 Tax=Geopseudomonas aromaticivorans TaxID=2849492 RepID=A0ABS6MVM5_9GAMM|nr:ribonuclease E inhibitor RraB [Pseudomonas aromaticivorans]